MQLISIKKLNRLTGLLITLYFLESKNTKCVWVFSQISVRYLIPRAHSFWCLHWEFGHEKKNETKLHYPSLESVCILLTERKPSWRPWRWDGESWALVPPAHYRHEGKRYDGAQLLAGWRTQLQSFLPHRQTVKCTCIRSGMNNRSRHQSGGLSLQLSMPRVWAQRSWKFLPLSLCPAKATLYLLAALSETQERRVRGGMNVS